jgi:hypothetical protein
MKGASVGNSPPTTYRCATFPSPTILKLSFVALAESPFLDVIGLYSVKTSFDTNIVSLAPESIKDVSFPLWKFWKVLLIKAEVERLVGASITTPDWTGIKAVEGELAGCQSQPLIGRGYQVFELRVRSDPFVR